MNRIRRHRLALLAAGAFLATAIVVLSSGSSLARSGRVRSSSEIDNFPLWKDVPGRSFAKLGEAKLADGTRWAAYASRVGAGRRGRENPVLTVARITDSPGFGQYNHSIASGRLAPTEGEPPVTATFMESDSFAARGGGETFIAMSFKPLIASILIMPAKGEAIRRRTHLLNRYQRRKTHLPTLRYVALGLEREVCISKLVGYSANGEVAFEAPYSECEPSPPGE